MNQDERRVNKMDDNKIQEMRQEKMIKKGNETKGKKRRMR